MISSFVLPAVVSVCPQLFIVSNATKIKAMLLADLLKETLNEELYMSFQAGLGLNVYPTKVMRNDWYPLYSMQGTLAGGEHAQAELLL